MNKSKLFCVLMTVIMTVALCAGGAAMLTVSDAVNTSYETSAPEGEDAVVSQTAENISAWTKSGNNYYKLYNYTGGVQSVILPRGTYKLEAWGAQGGKDATYYPGHGGYTTATYTITADTTVYIVVGGVGASSACGTGGGYNGGGNAGAYGSSGAGGGATHFATATGTLASLKSNTGAVLIVAGGGGGAGNGQTGNNLGWGGGSSPGANAGGTGALSGNSAYFGQGQASQMGLAAGTNNDGGGGGGGWYGGAGATSDSQGAGGSAYVNTSKCTGASYINGNASMPNPTAFGSNYTKGQSHNGLHGYARITSVNSAPIAKTGVAKTISRTGTGAVSVSDLATDVVPANDSLTYVAQEIYTNSACTTSAKNTYFTYTASSATSITLHPVKRFTTTTFYAKVKDTAGLQTVCSFTVNASAFNGITAQANGLKNSNTGIYGTSVKTGTNYPSMSSVTSSGYWSAASDIYNDGGANRRTYMITRPLETATSSVWNGLTSVVIKATDLAIGTDKYSNNYLDTVYFTTYSATGNGTNYSVAAAGSSAKWTQLTITPKLASKSGWFRIPVTIGLYENSSGAELTSASSGRLSVDIVFRIGNARPTLNSPVTVSLNTTTKKSQTVTIANLVTDANTNDLSFASGALTNVVKVPSNEYAYVDKYGNTLTAANYNVGTKSSSVITDASTTTATGFDRTSIYNAAMTDAASVYKEAYVSYSISGTSIVFNAIRATRNQYASGRANALGHFYILVHITDSGDTRDTGLWYPIAIRVDDTSAATKNALDFTLDAEEKGESTGVTAPADSVYISPYRHPSLSGVGIGALSADDASDTSKYVANALGSDESEFAVNVGSQVGSQPFAFNDFLHINSDFGSMTPGSDYYTSYETYVGFSAYVTAQIVPLYAPASWFDRLTAEQKTAAGITVSGDVASFNGIKLTAVSSTKERWVEIPVRLTDTFGNVTENVIAVKVNNRTTALRNTINEKGGMAVKTVDSATGEVTITYTMYNTTDKSYKISPYDLVYDADLAQQPAIDNNQNNNSNPDDGTANATLANILYRNSNKVRTRTSATGTASAVNFGYDTLSFVPSSLPFTLSGSGASSADYTQNRFTSELRMHYVPSTRTTAGGSMDYLEITPKQRNDGSNAYTMEGVRIVDESGSYITLNIAVRVINSLPYLKEPNKVFYLIADYMSENANSSQPVGGDDVGESYVTNFNDIGYNIREFAVREIVTDFDPTDVPSLEIVSAPKLGYVDASGTFVEVPEYSDYVSVEYNTMGTGTRSNYVVTRITGRNSTQSLEHGLYMQIEVTDGFNNKADRVKLEFRIEVLNSRPIYVGGAQFEEGKDPDDSAKHWNIKPANTGDVTAVRYIAPDEETAAILSQDGVLTSGGSIIKPSANHIKYFAFDYDELQRIMPYNKDATLLPVTSLETPNGIYSDDVAVIFGNPYGSDTPSQDQINNTVLIEWYIIGSDGRYHVVNPTDSADLAKYTAKDLDTCIREDVLHWAIKITPVTGFKPEGLTLTVGYRDTSSLGGCTTNANPDSYVGLRPTKTQITSHAGITFNIKIESLGMTNNLAAYANSDEEKNNVYYAYYFKDETSAPEAVYPAEKFTYGPVSLVSDANTGADEVTYIPVSYLAIPTTLRDNMQTTIDFLHSYALTDENGANPYRASGDERENILTDMSLYDPATGLTWSGADIDNNPYINIGVASAADIEGDNYLNKNLYYSGSSDTQKIIKRVWQEPDGTKHPLREDLFGLSLQKKNVRSKGYLELSITLAEYEYFGESPTGVINASASQKDESKTTVKLYIFVPNDNMRLDSTTVELSSASLTAAAGKPVTFAYGSQDGIISLVNDDAAKNALTRSDFRIYAGYDKQDYAADVAVEEGTRLFKERAYFLADSVTGKLTDAQRAHIFEGASNARTYGYNILDEHLAAYFGVKESDLDAVKDGTMTPSVNPGYTNFFTVSPLGRNDTSLLFHAVRRISVDEETAFAYYEKTNPGFDRTDLTERVAAYNAYAASEPELKGLRARAGANGSVEIYYPFRVIVYDDYESSGFANGSYQILQIDVRIANSLPYVNTAMVHNDGTDNYYDLDIAKGESYSVRISDFFGDSDMQTNSSRMFLQKDELAKVGVVALNTSDWYAVGEGNFNTLTLSDVTNSDDVAIDFNGYYGAAVKYDIDNIQPANSVRNNTLNRGYIRFTAINRTRNPISFKLHFADNAGNSVSIVFRITISNQAPVALIKDAGQSYVTSREIKMRTGEVFTVLPTSWDKFIGGLDGIGIPSQGMDDNFYGTLTKAQRELIAERYAIGAGSSDYALFGNRSNISETSSDLFMRYSFSDVGRKTSLDKDGFVFDSTSGTATHGYYDENGVYHESGSLGFLALADDDLPWGLKFRAANPFGISTTSLDWSAVNTVDNGRYAMGLQIKAVSGCTNVPVTFTVYDSEGKSIQFTFRITVENSNPYLLGGSVNPDYNIGFDSAENEYTVTMKYGQSLTLPITAICSDADANDRNNLRTYGMYNGSTFAIDSVQGVDSNSYVSLTDDRGSVTIKCTGVFLTSATSTLVEFYVVDNLATVPLLVKIRVSTVFGGLTDGESTAAFTAESVSEYTASGKASELALVSSSDKAAVTDNDYGSNAVYNVTAYALYDVVGGKAVPVEKSAVLANREKYRLVTFSAESGSYMYNSDTDAETRRALLGRYLDLAFSADGTKALVTPLGATLDFPFPLYFELTKVVAGIHTGEHPDIPVTAGMSATVNVADSAPYAVGQNDVNQGTFTQGIASPNYLTVRGTAGYSQTYPIWDTSRVEYSLFNDADFDDEIAFVSHEVVSLTNPDGSVLTPGDGWQENGKTPCAYSVTVKDGMLTAAIVRKVATKGGTAFVLPVKITVRDRSGKQASTIIRFEIHNSAPAYAPFEDDGYNVVEQDGEYLLDMKLKHGDKARIDVSRFLRDADIENGETFSIANDTANESLSLHDLDYSVNADLNVVHYAGITDESNMFAVRLADKNNLLFDIECLSASRGKTASVTLVLRDSSLASTPLRLRIRLTVANSAPVLVVQNPSITLLGGDDAESAVNASRFISITEWLNDPNPDDNGGGDTYMRVYAYEMGNVHAYGQTFEPGGENDLFTPLQPLEGNELLQKIRIIPIAGRYGSQELIIYVTDDGAMGAPDAVLVQFVLTIQVARDPDTVSLVDRTVPYAREDEITVEKIVPAPYVLGYKLVGLTQSVDNSEGTISVREDNGRYFVKGERRNSTAVLIATLTVGDRTKDLKFTMRVQGNDAPTYKLNADGFKITDYVYDGAALDASRTVRLNPSDWFVDPESDDIKFLDCSSSRTFIVTAALDTAHNRIELKFAARGSAEITIGLTDATGERFERVITVTNNTLPELNFFLAIAQSITVNPWLYLGIIIALIILLLLIVFIAGVYRRKKREQAEVEALLVSEMQLEDQMLRIAEAQQRQSGMLPPSDVSSGGGIYSQGGMPTFGGMLPPEFTGQGLPPGSGDDDGLNGGGY